VRHTILGAGAVGGLLGALLADQGEDVTVVLRDSTETFPTHMSLQRPDGSVLGGHARAVKSIDKDGAGDVLWVATKAMDLPEALNAVRGSSPRLVVPLLKRRFRQRQGSQRRSRSRLSVRSQVLYEFEAPLFACASALARNLSSWA
jgi:predicted dinucleotide-binding enzyme